MAATFPFTRLPYELQVMIAQEAVLSPIPIIVGRTVARWSADCQEVQEAVACNAMLRVSRRFRQELYTYYHKHNTFELGYYYDKNNFFTRDGSRFIERIQVDYTRICAQWNEIQAPFIAHLKMLPNLQFLTIRVRASFVQDNDRLRQHLVRFLDSVSCDTTIRSVELIVEPLPGATSPGIDTFPEYKEILKNLFAEIEQKEETVDEEQVMPKFEVHHEKLTAAGYALLAKRQPQKQLSTSERIRAWIRAYLVRARNGN